MRKVNKLMAVLIGLSLVLAACGQSDVDDDNPSLTEVPGGITTPSDLTPGAPLETPPVVTPDNATPSPEAPITTTESTLPAVTETVVATETVSPTQSTAGGEVLPPTGMIDPGRISNLLDFEVWNMNNERIGEVEDMVLDLGQSRVSYVVVDAEDNPDLIPVPWDALTVVSAQAMTSSTSQTTTVTTTAEGPQNAFVLKVDQAVFDATPPMDLDALPKLGEAAGDWDNDIHVYWQDNLKLETTTAPTTTVGTTGLTGVVRASELLDYDLQGGDGEVKAEVEDVIVDVNTGEIKYLVVGISEGLFGTDKLIPIPLGILSWDADNQMIIVTADPQLIITAPSFDKNTFPETFVPDWDVDLRDYWKDYIVVTP